jgi:hypothetical protein
VFLQLAVKGLITIVSAITKPGLPHPHSKRYQTICHFIYLFIFSPNKHCSKILQETLLNSVANDLLPFIVVQSRDSFTLLSVKDVGLVQHCQQANKMMCTGCKQEVLLSKPDCQIICLASMRE